MNMNVHLSFDAFTVLSLVLFHHQSDVTSANPCDAMTYIELGKSGIINCSFEEPVFGIFWYNSSSDIPVLFYQDSVKKGTGYMSGEYDIYPNGSLQINTVTLQHEAKFTVEFLSSPSSVPVEFEVDITVYVEPSPTFPLIDGCPNVTHNICFPQIQNQQLFCALHEVRPNISLSWMKRTSSGDRFITSGKFITPGRVWYTSHITTFMTLDHSPSLQLLVCKVEGPSGLLERDESLILLQRSNGSFQAVQPTQRLVELHKRLELSCAETDTMLIIWKRYQKANKEKELLLWYGVSRGEHVSKVVDEDYTFGVSGNLEIKQLEVQHEGLYICFFGDGLSDGVIKYQVDVYVNPEPNYLIIDGCNPNQYCVLEVGRSGNLTCSVKGIYPEVGLQLKPFYGDSISSIKLTSNQLVSKREGDTFHVSLSSTYEIKEMSSKKITIICQAVGVNAKWFNLDTKLDLLLMGEQNKEPATNLPGMIFQFILQTLIVIFTVLITVYFVNKYKDSRQEAQTESSCIELTKQNFSPKEMAVRQHLFNVMERIFKFHGAETIGTPVIQNSKEIVDKYSVTYSQKISYHLDKSKALRCDHTVPFALYIIKNKITSMTRYQIASVFRKDIEEAGRYRELYQCDFDIVSECKSLLADAECLKVVTDVLQTLGFGNVVTNVNHQDILEGFFEACGVPDDKYDDLTLWMEQNFNTINPCETLKNTLTKVANISPERAGDLVSFLKLNDFDELTRKLGGIKSVIADKIKEGMDQLQKLFEYCDILGIRRKVQFDCSVACALGIYNGVVFKTTLEDSASSGPENVNPAKRLASGGRYDGLFSRLAGKKVEIYAVGFAFYFEEIFSNYKSNQDIRSKETEFFITSDNEESCIKEKLKLCKESWNAKIKVEMSHSSDSANLQANTEGIRFIAHIGQSEIPKGLVHLEDIWTKEKISIETSKVTEYIKERLNDVKTTSELPEDDRQSSMVTKQGGVSMEQLQIRNIVH